MEARQLIYFLIFIFAFYFVFKNIKSNLDYKKENIQPLFYLTEDDKARRTLSNVIIAVVGLMTMMILTGSISSGQFTVELFVTSILLPVLMILLYLPLAKKTTISTLGIHKRGALVRWENVKGVNYSKPDSKSRIKASVLYTHSGRDLKLELLFNKDDSQLQSFKDAAKEYRNIKKKEKKNGK